MEVLGRFYLSPQSNAWAVWGCERLPTHPEQLESVESLTGNDGHHLHFA